jgi:hypothetical protein
LIQIIGWYLTLYGYLSANGLAGASSGNAGGGGSGGTINVYSQGLFSIMGSANISANGGDGGIASLGGGGGAGGCVYTNSTEIEVSFGYIATATGGKTACTGVVPNGTLIRKCAPGIALLPLIFIEHFK